MRNNSIYKIIFAFFSSFLNSYEIIFFSNQKQSHYHVYNCWEQVSYRNTVFSQKVLKSAAPMGLGSRDSFHIERSR